MGASVRLQKYLADRGVASRRESARLIRAGQVTVNGCAVVEPGLRVDETGCDVRLQGRPLTASPERRRTILFHKPQGCVCSRDGQGQPTVFEYLHGIAEQLRPVGRLDADSEGLLLLSNDGDLIQALTHPRHGSAKVYRVDVEGVAIEAALQKLRQPMTLDGYRLQSVAIRRGAVSRNENRTQLIFTLYEGRNRQIRRMCELAGLRVRRLVRIEQAGLRLNHLPAGRWRDLTPREYKTLREEKAGRE